MRDLKNLLLLATVLGTPLHPLRADPAVSARQITFGPQHHFFGYIGHVRTIPWNDSGRYIAALRTAFQDHMPKPDEAADVVLIDTQHDYAVKVVDRTRAWNFQQGTMLYWNPDAPETQFFFNDRDPATQNVFCVLFDVSRGKNGRRIREYRFEDTPIGNSGVAQNGGYFLGLNYGRLARLRLVTGYQGAHDWTEGVNHPDDDGIFKVNVTTKEKQLIVSYRQLRDALRTDSPGVDTTPLFINHTLWNRSDDRIYFYARGNFSSPERVNVPFTVNPDGTGLIRQRVHIGGHPEWEVGHRMIGKMGKDQVVYDTDRQEVVEKIGGPDIFPSPGADIALSPDGKWFVNGYRKSRQNFYVLFRRADSAFVRTEGFDINGWNSGELRLDPSPCWNRDSTQILFAATAQDEAKTRQLFLIRLKADGESADRIRPYEKNPSYWQYKGEPVLLLGGSKDDNPFQLPDLKAQLDEMKRAGANYVRNTMSDRPDKGFEVYPFKRLPNGKYDLDQWNDVYWRRFENFLKWTRERDIVVQIELWDRFDYSDGRRGARWSRHPYNPVNNVNYTEATSGLKKTYTKHPNSNEQPFFFTVPNARNNQVVLKYQQAQVDKMLSYSLKFGHVLYCMDNETSGIPEWGKYWSMHIRQRAREAGVEVHTTEMWDSWDPKKPVHRRTYDHPEIYSFVDISQNNHNSGQAHWDNLQWVRTYVAKRPRPINCVKTYGADTGRFGKSRDGEERVWRSVIGGLASSRFHRPESGLGLSERAKAHLRSLRLLTAELDIFRATPDAASRMLADREANEAYMTTIPGETYAVYFPDGGSVRLDLRQAKGEWAVKWLEIARSRWSQPKRAFGGQELQLTTPGKGHWVCLLQRVASR